MNIDQKTLFNHYYKRYANLCTQLVLNKDIKEETTCLFLSEIGIRSLWGCAENLRKITSDKETLFFIKSVFEFIKKIVFEKDKLTLEEVNNLIRKAANQNGVNYE